MAAKNNIDLSPALAKRISEVEHQLWDLRRVDAEKPRGWEGVGNALELARLELRLAGLYEAWELVTGVGWVTLPESLAVMHSRLERQEQRRARVRKHHDRGDGLEGETGTDQP